MENKRVRVNEVSALLKNISKESFDNLVLQYPDIAKEIVLGPDAGTPQENQEYIKQKALFTLNSSRQSLEGIAGIVRKIASTIQWVRRGKLLVVILGAVSSASTLLTIALGKDQAVLYLAIVSTLAALLNGVVGFYEGIYTSDLNKRVNQLAEFERLLNDELHELDLCVTTHQDENSIKTSIERCNELSKNLNRERDVLRTY